MVRALIIAALISLLLSTCGGMGQRQGEPAPIVDRHQKTTAVSPQTVTVTPVVETVVVSEPVSDADTSREAQQLAYAPPQSVSEKQTKTLVPQKANTKSAENNSQQAVLSLVAHSEQQARSGDITGAVSTLERALRIDPKNARLWNRLAHLRLEQKQFQQAADLAGKSNALAGQDAILKRDNWLLISLAKRSEGDNTAADEAAKRAKKYEN